MGSNHSLGLGFIIILVPFLYGGEVLAPKASWSEKDLLDSDLDIVENSWEEPGQELIGT